MSAIFLFTGTGVLAGTFGITEGAFGSGISLDDRVAGSMFNLSEKGLLQSISANLTINAGGDPFTTNKAIAGVYNASGNLVAQSNERVWEVPFGEPISQTWQTFTFSESATLTAGNYWLVVWSETPSYVYLNRVDLSTGQTWKLQAVYTENLPISFSEATLDGANTSFINATYSAYDLISFMPENISSLLAHVQTLMSDVSVVMWFAIGLPLGFVLIRKTISLVRKR